MKYVNGWWLPENELQMVPTIVKTGTWQTEKLGHFASHFHETGREPYSLSVALDIGAHVGTWSIALAAYVDEVHAFEPNPEAYACLIRNIRNREGGDLIRPYQLALGRFRQRAMIRDDDRLGAENTGGSFVDLTVNASVGPRSVSVSTLDDVYESGVAFSRVDIIKIDVEGMEALVVEGGLRLLSNFKPLVIWENKPKLAGRYAGRSIGTPETILMSIGAEQLCRLGADELWGWKA